MSALIRVQPTSALRREFAKWAVQHRIRTVASTTFGVPTELFPRIPENLLRGALIDGQHYVAARRKKGHSAQAAQKGAAKARTAQRDDGSKAAPVTKRVPAKPTASPEPRRPIADVRSDLLNEPAPTEPIPAEPDLEADQGPALPPVAAFAATVYGTNTLAGDSNERDEPAAEEFVPEPHAETSPTTDADTIDDTEQATHADPERKNWCDPCARAFSSAQRLRTHQAAKHPNLRGGEG